MILQVMCRQIQHHRIQRTHQPFYLQVSTILEKKFPYHNIQSKYHFIIAIHLLVYSLLFLLIVFIVDYFQVFVKHFDDLVEVVSFPLCLAHGLRRAKLVPQQAVDSILNSKESQDLINTRLLREVRNLLKVSKKQSRTRIITFCQVLSDQDNPVLSDIATDILEECGMIQQ